MERSRDTGRPADVADAHLRAPSAVLPPQHAALLALQRTVGNRVVSRQMPMPGVPPIIGGLLSPKSDLDRVKDLLEYGVADWAITDEDATRATRILADMGDAELTSAVTELDGSPTPYLDRLVDNATLGVVRSSGFAKIMGKRAPGRNAALAATLVSYGILDWEVTPPEAAAAQTLMDALPERERDRLGEEWIERRIKENLPGEGDYEQGVGEQLLDGAIRGDFNEDPTFWNVCAQIGVGFVPYAGQVADIRDLINALDEMFNRGGYKKFLSWMNLILILIGFVPGIGDAIKAVGRGAINIVKRSAFRVGRGLWEAANRHLIEPLVKHLFPEAIQKAKARLRTLLEERAARLADKSPHVRGEGSAVPGESALPSPAKLAERTDEAFAEAAAQAPRRIDDIVGDLVREGIDALREWAEKVFKRLEFTRFEIEIHGDELVLYGIGSKFKLIRANISSVKKFVIQKSESMLTALRSREARLAAARAASGEVADGIRQGAVMVSEEIGERIADIVIKREFSGAKLRFTGAGSGTLDRVFEMGGVLHVVEAKGGAGRLGSREIGPGLRAQQGTVEYLNSVLANMLKRGGEEADIAKELMKKMQAPGKVRMWVSATGPLNARSSEPIIAKLMEVVL